MGELRAAGDITGRPDMISRGAKVVIHPDEPAVGEINTGRRQPELSGHRSAPSRDEQLLAPHLGAVFKDRDNLAVIGITTDSLGSGAQS
jgi:hypothetical protein